MTLTEIIERYPIEPEYVKSIMLKQALAVVSANAGLDRRNEHAEFDSCTINYSFFCDELGWPDFQDGGIFEQVITKACAIVAWIRGDKAEYDD